MELVRLSDYTSQERAAIVTMELLVCGRVLSTAQIAQRVGLTWQRADAMMNTISRVVPVYKEAGCWRKVND